MFFFVSRLPCGCLEFERRISRMKTLEKYPSRSLKRTPTMALEYVRERGVVGERKTLTGGERRVGEENGESAVADGESGSWRARGVGVGANR